MHQLFPQSLRYGLSVSVLALFGACAASPAPQPNPPAASLPAPVEVSASPSTDAATDVPPPAPLAVASLPTPQPPVFASSGHPVLDAWRADFAERAVSEGRDPQLVKSLLSGIGPLEAFLPKTVPNRGTQSDAANQAEFAKPIWEYVDSAVSQSRQQNGTRYVRDMRELLDELELNFAVDKEAIVAIWAMETNFGGYIGDFDGPETLANMAAEGRRRSLAERELHAMMTIIERGEARREDLISGWAGAMGQTQFMPSVYLSRAVDWDGDGFKDVWNSKADALASAANYLALAGYNKDEAWGTEVTLPDGFDFTLSDGQFRRVSEWKGLGVSVPASIAEGVSDSMGGRLWLPAGASGPKFLLFNNFDVFLNYNRANAYAFSVGLLSDVFAARPGIQASWPRGDAPLTRDEIKQLQAALNDKGYPAGPVDGIAGSGTRRALQNFQRDKGLIADGYPSKAVLPYVIG